MRINLRLQQPYCVQPGMPLNDVKQLIKSLDRDVCSAGLSGTPPQLAQCEGQSRVPRPHLALRHVLHDVLIQGYRVAIPADMDVGVRQLSGHHTEAQALPSERRLRQLRCLLKRANCLRVLVPDEHLRARRLVLWAVEPLQFSLQGALRRHKAPRINQPFCVLAAGRQASVLRARRREERKEACAARWHPHWSRRRRVDVRVGRAFAQAKPRPRDRGCNVNSQLASFITHLSN
eukprot:3304713-Prymnesium_polylepis.2